MAVQDESHNPRARSPEGSGSESVDKPGNVSRSGGDAADPGIELTGELGSGQNVTTPNRLQKAENAPVSIANPATATPQESAAIASTKTDPMSMEPLWYEWAAMTPTAYVWVTLGTAVTTFACPALQVGSVKIASCCRSFVAVPALPENLFLG